MGHTLERWDLLTSFVAPTQPDHVWHWRSLCIEAGRWQPGLSCAGLGQSIHNTHFCQRVAVNAEGQHQGQCSYHCRCRQTHWMLPKTLPLTKDYFCLNYCKTDDSVGSGKTHFYKEDVWGLFLALVDIGKTYICKIRCWMCCCVTECVSCSRLADKAIKKRSPGCLVS